MMSNILDSEKYPYFRNPHQPKEEVIFNKPLSVPESDDQFWIDVTNQISDYLDELRSSLDSEYSDLDFHENPANIISGSINLINLIIEKSASEPIDFIFFLDKSARLAAHVFRVMWATLEKQKKVPSGVIRPKIKFINIGLEENTKHDSPRATQIASDSFSDIPENSNILMVDEVISSGNSLKKSIQFAQQHLKSKAFGISNFLHIPVWYLQDEVKGVQDVEIWEGIFDLMDQMDPKVFSVLEKICKSNLPVYDILEFIEDAIKNNKNLFVLKYSEKKLIPELDKKLLEEIHDQLYYPVDKITIYKYFKTSGGFFAMRPMKHEYYQSLIYRKMLTKMVELSADAVQLNN